MKIVASKVDIIWNYAGTIFSLSSSFILLPFILIFLSPDELGLWYVFLAINGLVNMFDFGFDPTFARNIAYAWTGAKSITKTGANFDNLKTDPNFSLLKLLLKSSKILYLIISVIALSIVSTIGTIYIIHISGKLEGSNYLIAWAIFCISLFLNLYMGYFSAILRGIGAISVINKATVVSKFCQLLVSVILLAFNFRLIAVAIGFCINGVMLRLICNHAFLRFHNIGKKLNEVSETYTLKNCFALLKVISFNAYRDGIVAVSNYLTTQSSSLIVSMFLSLSQTGTYSIALQFANAVSNVAAAMIYALHPTLQSAFLRKDRKMEISVISRGLTSFYFINIIGVIAIVVLVFPILHIIKPTLIMDVPFFLVLSLYVFLWQQQSISASYIANTNVVPYVKAFVVSSVLGVVLSFLLINYTSLGIWAVIVGPGIVQMAYNNWKWPKYVSNYLEKPFSQIILNGVILWVHDIRKKLA